MTREVEEKMVTKIIKSGVSKEGVARRSGVDIMPDEGGVVHKRVTDAKQHASEIVDAAEKEANMIREEADAVLADARIKKDEAIKAGFASGETKGLAQVTEKLVAFERLREKFYADAEPEMIKLVMEIAEKVIGRAITENPQLIYSVIKQALEKALGDRITVRLNPEDYKTVMEGDAAMREMADRTKRLVFREDDSITKGGCIVETEVGTIDALLETQMDAIRKALIV